ncbi:hypothetical protein prwr041_13260 [Prevotella herbatica]|uniref:Uncharacterized protein n=1 Tax=Prevotella herbatica TaxID=2801997 RepID=A0ABM7NYE6_9BACT|nr:hypothetical protein prwr041_13260 [Prevotella herbatica]
MAIFAIAQTVYITKTGSKYHSDGCRYLSRSCIPINLSEAKFEGYDPCSVCDPPTYVYKRHVTHSKKRHEVYKRHHHKSVKKKF